MSFHPVSVQERISVEGRGGGGWGGAHVQMPKEVVVVEKEGIFLLSTASSYKGYYPFC